MSTILWLLLSLGGAAGFNISDAYIIALDTSANELQTQVKCHLHIPHVHLFAAINGTRALLQLPTLPLYTRFLFAIKARHDHMQLSSDAMLGCLLSHMAIWRLVLPGAIVAVFEEDGVVDAVSAQRLAILERDLADSRWDLLMLESGQFTATGKWRAVGQIAATCATLCTWQGSRGYLVSYRGAQALLRFAEPIMVQVDALMGLVAAFEPGFRMYWTLSDVVHPSRMRMSTIWDACIKCYLPPGAHLFYVACSLLLFCGCLYCKAAAYKKRGHTLMALWQTTKRAFTLRLPCLGCCYQTCPA